jgi:hypothetical protein
LDRNQPPLSYALTAIFIFFPAFLSALFAVTARGAQASETTFSWSPEAMISFPQPLQLGVDLACKGGTIFCRSELSYFLEAGYFRYPIFGTATRQVSLSGVELGVRYTPFKVPFYFAGSLGYRHLSFSVDTSQFQFDDGTGPTSGMISLNAIYLSPTVGYQVSLTNRLSLSFEVGAQIPVTAWGDLYLLDANTGENSDNSASYDTDSSTPIGQVAGLPIPCFTLVRLSWLMGK